MKRKLREKRFHADRAIDRGISGATLGGTLGGALGTIFAGAVIALPGINIVLAPFAAVAAVSTATISCGAVGTALGGAAGAISGGLDREREEV